MRAKVAKTLRRMARKNAADNGWPERDMMVVNIHQKQYPWLIKTTMGADGVAIPVDLGVRTVAQHVNGHQSERGQYLRMKKLYRAQFGHR